jgi:hypothetical protein
MACFGVPYLNYARAVALGQLGKYDLAKQACLEELKLQPGFAGAAKMLEWLNRAVDQNVDSNEKDGSKIKAGAAQLFKKCV